MSPRRTYTTKLCMKTVYLSNPKPGHITGGSSESARRNGRAMSSRIGCQLFISKIIAHVWYEKSLQRQIRISTLISSQERKSFFVPLFASKPRIYWLPTAVLSLVFGCFTGLHRNSFVRHCTEMCRGIPEMQRRRYTSQYSDRIQE